MNLKSREMRSSLRRLKSFAKRMIFSALEALSRELDAFLPFVNINVMESNGTEEMKSTTNHPRRYRFATAIGSNITYKIINITEALYE